MQKNVGEKDKAIRLLIGVVIIGIGFYFKSWWGAVGLIPILSGFLNYCPLYQALGKSTSCCGSEATEEKKE
jgi:hypothetical protein